MVMGLILYKLFALMQLSFIYGSIIQNKCWISDSPCLTARAQAVVPVITAGKSELGIEPLDFMVIDGLHINDNGFKHEWNTTHVRGLRNAIVDELSIDLNTKIIRLVFSSDMIVKGFYVQEGYLLSMPIEGAGKLRMEFDNVQMEMRVSFDIIKDFYSMDTVDLKDFQYDFEIQGARFYFGNLYYGNNELSRKMHTLINRNWKQFTTKYGRYLFDKINSKIFNAIRTYLYFLPLETVCLYKI